MKALSILHEIILTIDQPRRGLELRVEGVKGDGSWTLHIVAHLQVLPSMGALPLEGGGKGKSFQVSFWQRKQARRSGDNGTSAGIPDLLRYLHQSIQRQLVVNGTVVAKPKSLLKRGSGLPITSE